LFHRPYFIDLMPKARKNVGAKVAPLSKGVGKLGRSAAYHLSGRWKIKSRGSVTAQKAAAAATAPKSKPFGKSTRSVPAQRDTRFYPAEDGGRRLYVRKTARPTRVRPSLAAGVVAIVLAGRFRGKRVVVLKVLPSGLALVTGPYKINGVPMRRVNPVYLIATGTKVDLAGAAVDAKFDDKYFRRPAKAVKDALFAAEAAKAKTPVDAGRKADQKSVDAAVLAAVKKVPQLADYLNAKFSLVKGQYPHQLKF